MAEKDKQIYMSIKVVVDKETNKVAFVESNYDFVDVLLSFLTLPIATIVRLTRDDNIQSSSNVIGCMENLYKSAENLATQHLMTEECKTMLLFPRRASEFICNKLKLKIDDLEPTKMHYCSRHSDTVNYSQRLSCGCSDSFCITTLFAERKTDGGEGVFVEGGMERYIISDDLQIKSASMGTCLSLLGKNGIRDCCGLEESNVDVGLKEVLHLLKCSLISNSPLTDMLFGQEPEKLVKTPEHQNENKATYNGKNVDVKLVVRKSNNQALYAVAKEDFLDLIFSFLTFPLGSIVKLCGGNSSAIWVDNLYKSVEDLSSDGQIKAPELKAMLASPKLAPHFGCENQLLSIDEALPLYKRRGPKSSSSSSNSDEGDFVRVMNPKSTNGDTCGGGFIRGPATFMVTNDLVVEPYCLTSGLFLLKTLQVPFCDVEERTVSVSEPEALNLLKASLVSNTALNSLIDDMDDVDLVRSWTGQLNF